MTLYFRETKPGTTSHKDSPLLSVFGEDKNGDIIIPIDFVVFDDDGFNPQLPSLVTGEEITLNGGGPIGVIPSLSINLIPGGI
jgi:hypothetical protein